MRRSAILALGALLCALSVTAQDETPYTISPARGPSSGGTVVTLTGPFTPYGGFPHIVYIGGVSAVTTYVDDSTLIAVTPPHAPGVVDVTLFEYDIFLSTGLTFEYTETVANSELELLLLPIFTPPVKGAFGSEFWTRLTATNTGPHEFEIKGLLQDCPFSSPMLCDPGLPAGLGPGGDLIPFLAYSGTPGRFIAIPREDDPYFSANLRVFDVSRSANNFGTEIPIVRYREFRHEPFALMDVPLHQQFRKALRLYAAEGTQVQIRVGTETHAVTLHRSGQPFEPAYAMFTNFPTDSRLVTVIVEPGGPTQPAVWGFISVTSNDTQLITTITPR